jgi:hypothetical protein
MVSLIRDNKGTTDVPGNIIDYKCTDPICGHHHSPPPDNGKAGWILRELGAHLPYSMSSAIASLIFLAIMTAAGLVGHLLTFFHLFHPTHLFLSATTTTAVFWSRGKRNRFAFIEAIIIGIIGSVPFCTLSDIIFPYTAGKILQHQMAWHLCIVEDFWLVSPFVIGGVIAGLVAGQYRDKSTFFSHSAHIFVSTTASVLYLITFGLTDWVNYLGWIVVILTISVLIPCCLSDIVFPLIFIRSKPRADQIGRS